MWPPTSRGDIYPKDHFSQPYLSLPHPYPPAPTLLARWTARQSLCLDFQGLQSIWGRGACWLSQGLSKKWPSSVQEEKKLDELIQSCTPGPQTVNRGFRESKISFCHLFSGGQCFLDYFRVDHLTLMCKVEFYPSFIQVSWAGRGDMYVYSVCMEW